jgi:hypothetical protein
MTVTEKAKTRFTWVDVVEKALAVGACLVFLGSVAFPFYRFVPPVMRGPVEHPSEFLWAYKLRTEYLLKSHAPEEFWFDGYWFRQTTTRYDNLQFNLPLMLVAQIVTIAAAIASIMKRGKVLAFIPVAGCSITIALMAFTANALSAANTFFVDPYQTGYRLAYPSLALFILSFLLTLKPRKASEAQSTPQPPPQTAQAPLFQLLPQHSEQTAEAWCPDARAEG